MSTTSSEREERTESAPSSLTDCRCCGHPYADHASACSTCDCQKYTSPDAGWCDNCQAAQCYRSQEACQHKDWSYEARQNGWEQRTCLHCGRVWLDESAESSELEPVRQQVLMQAIGYQIGDQLFEMLVPVGAVARYENGMITIQQSSGDACGIDGIVQIRMVAV